MSKDLIQDLTTPPPRDLYNPYPLLQNVRGDLTAAASIKDKPEKLLKLLQIDENLTRINYQIKAAVIERGKDLYPVNTVQCLPFFSCLLIGGVLPTLLFPQEMYIVQVLYTFPGVVGGFISGIVAGIVCNEVWSAITGVNKYEGIFGYKYGLKGLSKELKNFVTQGIDLTNELKRETQAVFAQTHEELKNNNYRDVASSPLKDELFSKIPSLSADFIRATGGYGTPKNNAGPDANGTVTTVASPKP